MDAIPWPEALRAHLARASIHQLQGRYREAERELQAALRLAEREAQADSVELADAASALGLLLSSLGNPAEAEGVLRLAVRTYECSCGTMHPALVAPLSALGAVCQLRGDLAEAQRLYQRVFAIAAADAAEAASAPIFG